MIERLGSVAHINPKVIEGLCAADLAYLQEFYNRINRSGKATLDTACPKCAHEFAVEMNASGDRRLPPAGAVQEVAFVAYHFHWPPESVLTLEHAERRRWVDEISAINERANSEANA